MNITTRIEPLLPYLSEIKFSDNLLLIGGLFYPKWIVNQKKNSPVKTHKTGNDEQGKVIYHFYTEKNKLDIDGLLDYFEEVVNENLDRERKEDLFKKKMEELKVVFKTNTLTDLENLEIDIKEDEIEGSPGYTQLDE